MIREDDMTTRFPTLAEALAAGYRKCGAKYGDIDTSGGAEGSVGYSYQAQDGRESTEVRLTETKNAGGTIGATIALMPLTPGVTAEQEAAAVAESNRRADIESGW